MKLDKCLDIIKSAKFTIYVYPKGHVKEARGLNEVPLKIIDLKRNKEGELPPDIEFAKAKVTEIIPCREHVNLVVEVKY